MRASELLTNLPELASRLVTTPGWNPMGRGAKSDGWGEEAVAEFAAELAAAAGADVAWHRTSEGRPCVIAGFDFGCARTLVLDCHLDTVPPDPEGGAWPPPGTWHEGELWGRGACDVRGLLAACLWSLAGARREAPQFNVLLLCPCDEEYGFTGAESLAAAAPWRGWPEPAGVVALEPTGFDVVHAHKGLVRWTVSTRGTAAHASRPAEGENAIYRMAGVVRRLEAYAGELMRGPDAAAMGPATLSVGTIRGGVAVNVVPPHCEAEVDRRLLPGETVADATAALHEALAGTGADVSEPFVQCPPLNTAPDHPFVEEVVRAAQTVRRDAHAVAVPYGTDAPFYRATGLPSVVAGPGRIALAHRADERISLDELEQGARFFTRLVCGP